MSIQLTSTSTPAPARHAAEGARKHEASRAGASGSEGTAAQGARDGFLSLLAAFGAEEEADGGVGLELVLGVGEGASVLPATDPAAKASGEAAAMTPLAVVTPGSAATSEVPAWLLAGQMLQGRATEATAVPDAPSQTVGANVDPGAGLDGARSAGRGLRAGAGVQVSAVGKEAARFAALEATRQAPGLAVAQMAQADDGQPGLRLGQAVGLAPLGGAGTADAVTGRGAGRSEFAGMVAQELASASGGVMAAAGATGQQTSGDAARQQRQEEPSVAVDGASAVGDAGLGMPGVPGVMASEGAVSGEAAGAHSPEARIAEQVRYWISDNVQNAELTLDPWGTPVEVAISLAGNEARVDFRTDVQDVRRLLEGSVTHLRELLRGEGLVLSGVSVGASGADAQGAREREPSAARPVVRRATVSVPAAASGGPAGARALSATSGRVVDMFV